MESKGVEMGTFGTHKPQSCLAMMTVHTFRYAMIPHIRPTLKYTLSVLPQPCA